MPIRGFLRRIFTRRQPDDGPADAQVDALRIEFRDRYHSFKLLLSANNKALEIMAGIEEALHGSRPFGMAFVRAACTSVSVNVFSMIRNIERLAPEKYAGLFANFDGIQRGIDEILTRRKVIEDERLVIPLSHVTKDLADVVGGKMANLSEKTPPAARLPASTAPS
jgi:pyruvate,water dikinase